MEAVPAADGSVYQEYTITTKGRALLPTLVALAQWSSEYLFVNRLPNLGSAQHVDAVPCWIMPTCCVLIVSRNVWSRCSVYASLKLLVTQIEL